MGFYLRKLLLGMNELNTTTGKKGLIHSPAASPLPLAVSVPHLHSDESDPAHFWSHVVGDQYHLNQIHVIQVVLIIIACTIGLLLFFITVFKILGHCYSRRSHFRRRSSPIIFDLNGDSPVSDDEGPAIDHPIWFIHTVGLSQSVIDSITVCKYIKDEGLIDGTVCSVCLSEFEEDESLKLLPKCNHAFHVACIDTWLRSHKNCPLCRAPVVREMASTEESVGEASSNVSGVENEESQIELNLEDGGGLGSHRLEEGGSSGPTVGDDDSVQLEKKDGGYTEVVPERTLKRCLFLTDSAMNEHEEDAEIQPVRRSISVDSCSASMIYGAVVDLNFDEERQRRQVDVRRNSRGKGIAGIGRQGIGGSTIYKLASIGRALQKRPISMKRSFSHNRKFRPASRHCRSQSSTLPL